MVVNHQSLTFGPAAIDPIVKLNDGAESIRTIGAEVRKFLDSGVPIVHLHLNASSDCNSQNGRRLDGDELGVVRDRLNGVFTGQCKACVKPNGTLEVIKGGLNYLHPFDVEDKIGSYCCSLITNPDSAFDVSPQFWEDHVHGAQATLRENKWKAGRELYPREALGFLNGRSGEFLMQHVLERYLAEPPDPKDRQARLIHRRHSVRFPDGPSETDASYHLNFRTLYNCELDSRKKGGCITSQKHQMSVSKKTITELDALAITGLDPAHRDSYTTLYDFEPTTMRQLTVKIAEKQRKMRPFIEDMKARGVDTHVFHMLLHSEYEFPSKEEIPLPPNTHLVMLPLASLVERVSRETAKELKIKL